MVIVIHKHTVCSPVSILAVRGFFAAPNLTKQVLRPKSQHYGALFYAAEVIFSEFLNSSSATLEKP